MWDIGQETPLLIDRVPIGTWVSDIAWLDDRRIGAALLFPGEERVAWRVVDLEHAAIVAQAKRSLIRDFTPEECQTYRVERCMP